MFKIVLLSILFTLTSHHSASAIIDLNTLSAESADMVGVERANAQEVVKEKGVDKVEVVRKQRGLFLALVPINFTVRAVAYPDGTVEVFYPWYSSITVDHKQIVKTKVKIAVDNALKTSLVGSVRAEGVSSNPKFSAKGAQKVEEKMLEVLSKSFSENSNTQ